MGTNQGVMIGLLGLDSLSRSVQETSGYWPFVVHGGRGERLGYGVGFIPLRGEKRSRNSSDIDSHLICSCGDVVELRLDMRSQTLCLRCINGSDAGETSLFAGLDEAGYRLAVSLSAEGNRVSILEFHHADA